MAAVSRADHWLRQNAALRTPRRLIVFDSEATTELGVRAEQHRFRLACASYDELDEAARPLGEQERADFDDPLALWEWVASHTNRSHRLVVFAHNLSYDLRLTGALDHLPALGFEPTRVALNEHSCWARFAHGRKTILLCDSLSWMPVTLDRIARLQRMRRRRLPAQDAPETAWRARCRDDVRVLRAAVLNLLAWVHDDELGDFRATGHAQASAAFRHRFLTPRTILVHWDPDARLAERRAAWTGRAEVWRPGWQRGPLHEYDFTAAYAHIAEREALPIRLLGQTRGSGRTAPLELGPTRTALYECTVSTEQPTVPTLLGERIGWPCGTFQTTLWQHELQLALSEGATVTIERAWLYEAAPVLRGWARWVLAGLEGQPPGDDELRRLVLKTWSRALIGRFGLRYPSMVALRMEEEPAVQLATVWDAVAGHSVKELQVGRQVYEQGADEDSPSSTPALMSAVVSHGRVRLWRVMRAAGLDNVLYVDTDSVLVGPAGAERIEAQLRAGRLAGLRLKGSYRSAELRSPRNVDVGEERRIAGLPRQAGRQPDGRFEAEVWESLPASIRRRRPSSVFRLQRSFLIGTADYRRHQLAEGGSEPYRLPADAALLAAGAPDRAA